MEKLNQVYEILSKISVSGDSVDLMAMAKQLLREIYAEMHNKEEE